MKFAVKIISKNSGRLGTLTKSELLELNTPLVMHYTKAGSIPFIAREIFDSMSVKTPTIEISLENTNHMEEAVKLFGKGIAAFAGLEHALSVVTLKDPAVSNPSYHNRESISIIPRGGKTTITPEKYMDFIENFQPDIFHALSDGDTSESCAKKRIINAIDRTEYFFDKCLERYKNSPILTNSMLLAPITGGYSTVYREAFIKSLNLKDHQDIIAGYFLDGFHTNGSTATQVDSEQVKSIVANCVDQLPNEKLKMMLGAYNPLLTLELIQLGIDIFDTTFAYLTSSKNCALTFNYNLNKESAANSEYEIDLTDLRFKDDFSPLLENCSCIACEKHTRAYVYHLVNTGELLGPILLMIHNSHHYLDFFDTIRQSIANDTLPQLIELLKIQNKQHDLQELENQQQKQTDANNENETNSVLKKVRIDD